MSLPSPQPIPPSRTPDDFADVVARDWDLVVVGGGATGAAVLHEAVRCGVRALLLERRDFASGTSSRSTKLAHGGLRYLDTGDVALVRESIRERDRLVEEGSGLAKRLPFFLATRLQEGLRHVKARIGVAAYGVLAGWRLPVTYAPVDIARLAPGFAVRDDHAGLAYEEAAIDDARLVLRLLQQAVDGGGVALNDVAVEGLVRAHGRVAGVRLHDVRGQRRGEVRTRAVVNATGVWADEVRGAAGLDARLRPVRGCHLHLPASRLPLSHAVSFRHPRDGRFVCAVPWEDVVVVGTTEAEHDAPFDDPRVTPDEARYLLEALESAFPGRAIGARDVVSCMAGLRALADGGEGPLSDVSRDHHLFDDDDGLVTITGGKLTTCRPMAHAALRALSSRLPALDRLGEDGAFLAPAPARPQRVDEATWSRLAGRYGPRAADVLACARDGELARVGSSSTLWVELRWAIRHERVRCLEDLLLRRVRVGLMLAHGAAAELPRVRELCADELGWDDARWAEEEAAYRASWDRQHAMPPLD